MKLRTRTSIAAVAVASVVGGGITGAVLTGPAAAFAQEVEDETSAAAESVSTVDDVLAGFVADGTLTQAQAEAVATAIDEARSSHRGGRHGGRFLGDAAENVAGILGITVDALSEAMSDGTSIADLATGNGANVQDIVDILAAQSQERLDAAVADGRLTADEAAEKSADIESRVTDQVNGEFERGSHGHRGRGLAPATGDAAAEA